MKDEFTISGSVAVERGGDIHIASLVGDTEINFKVEAYEEHYVVYFPSMSGIRITDVIEAKVEIASVLRESYGYDEDELDACKCCIERAWREPSEVYCNIQELISEEL